MDHNFRGYLAVLSGMTAGGFMLAAAAALIVDPFGMSPISIPIPWLNTVKVARNNNDRLVKPYDAVAMQPRTVFIGTSRVKQAFDPEFVTDPAFKPVYNSGIDALRMVEARKLIDLFVRDRLPIRHIFMELFPYQFGFSGWPPPGRFSRQDRLTDALDVTFSLFALRAELDTIKTSWANDAIAVQPNGLYPAGHEHIGPHFASPQWFAAIKNFKITPLNLSAFEDLDAIIALCANRNIDLRLFVGPLHPVLAYLFWSTGENVVREWVARLSERPAIISFLTTDEFFERELDRPHPYWSDSSHVSFRAAKMIIGDLVAAPHLTYGKMLDRKTAGDTLSQWKRMLASWAALNPKYVKDLRAAVPAVIAD